VRTLIILRHAQAAEGSGLPDRERPLTADGERDAQRVGAQLGSLGLVPEVVLCSPAARARRTAELAFPGVEISVERGIYEAYPDELYELVRGTDPEVKTVVLCGHNPGVHEMAISLTNGNHSFGPGSFAVVEFVAPWVDLWPGAGRLVGHWDPRARQM